MKKNKFSYLSVAVVTAFVSLMGVFSPVVFADAKSAACAGAGLVANGGSCDAAPGDPNVESAVQKGINLFSAVVGIIAVVMIIVGGLKFMTSQGDASQANSARNTLIYAAVGLVIVALAQLIVKFVLERFTKT